MDNVLLLNLIFAFVLLLEGLMFLEGIWHKNNKAVFIKTFLDVDNYLFPALKDKRILKVGDKLAFAVCALMAMLTLLNGLIAYFLKSVPNVSAIFIFVAVVMAWPIRIIFILIYRNKLGKRGSS